MKLHSISDANEDSMRFLARVNHQSEVMWNVFFKYVMGYVTITTMILSLLTLGFCLISNDEFTPECVHHPFLTVLVNKTPFVIIIS